MKTTFDYFNDKKIEFTFHDYKKLGISAETLNTWCAMVSHSKCIDWQLLVNKKGTTWRKLCQQEGFNPDIDQTEAIALMMENTSLIKRPVLSFIDHQNKARVLCGVDETLWNTLF